MAHQLQQRSDKMGVRSQTKSGQTATPSASPAVIKVDDNHPVRLEEKDEFYHDILDGLAVFLDSPLILDILHAVREYPLLRLGHALNESQMRCKKWLLDRLAENCGTRFGAVYILGGWYGVLGAMFLHDPRFTVNKVVSIDIDAQCKAIAEALNRVHVQSERFVSMTGDAYNLDYSRLIKSHAADPKPDLLINTSCEHLTSTEAWIEKIPDRTLVAVQSNDYFNCAEHINCVPDLATFRQQVQLSQVIYQGQIELKRYKRFMLIGVK